MQLLRDHLPLFTAAVGFALPLLLSFVQRERWQTRTKALVTFVAAFGAAAVSTWAAGQLDATSYLRSALTILVASLATYEGFYKPTGIAGAIAAKLQPGAGQTPAAKAVSVQQQLEDMVKLVESHGAAIAQLLKLAPTAKKPGARPSATKKTTAAKKTGGPKA